MKKDKKIERIKKNIEAREECLKILYAYNLTKIKYDSNSKLAIEMGTKILDNKKKIDNEINKYSKNRTVKQLNVVILSILEIAFFELQTTTIDKAIIFNEAIELAKKYTDKKSSGFVNAVLSSIKEEWYV